MRKKTEDKYNVMLDRMGAAYGARDARESFSASVPMAQKLNDAIQDSSDFLKKISIIPQEDIKGEVDTMVIPTTLAKRTNVAEGDREPTMDPDLSERTWECKFTEFDVGITYIKLDQWARFKDFAQRYMNAIYLRIALDRIMIGWHGTSAAAATDRDANPNLEDVNTGWLFDLKTNNAGHYVTEGDVEAGKIQIGETGDYQNLHQLVYDVGTLIEDKDRTGQEVAIIGRGLVAKDMNKVLAKHGETPTEMAHFDILSQSFGGYKSVMVPNFPEYGVLVSDLANLQLYWQLSSLRRKAEDQPKKNRVVDFISQNECYRIGNLDGAAAIEAENVKFV